MNNISAALKNTLASEKQGEGYLARPAGSTVMGLDVSNGLDVAKWLEQLDWQDVTDEATEIGVRFGACRYFRAPIPAVYTGFEAIRLVEELDDADHPNVKLVKGHHGNFELQLEGLRPIMTHVVHIIIGNVADFPNGEVSDETAGVVTWYPGRLTAPVDIGKATVKGVS
jgi:hypothetical protein